MSPKNENQLAEEARQICRKIGVGIAQDVCFGWAGAKGETLIEGPANLQSGRYLADFIGGFTYLGGGASIFRHVASIGRFCSIANNVVMGQVEHPTDYLSAHPLFEGEFDWPQLSEFRARNAPAIAKAAALAGTRVQGRADKIVVGNDVWIGEGAFIRRGVTIGDGAVIASRAVVVKDVPPYTIVGGIPAKPIKTRFPPDIIAELMRLQWWNYGLSALDDADFTDIEQAVRTIDRNIASGRAEPYSGRLVHIDAEEGVTLCRFDRLSGWLAPIAPEPAFSDSEAVLC